MILGMSTANFTVLHVVISLVGILSGLFVLFGMFGSKRLDGRTALFLGTTVLTSVTGYFFPRDHILPSHVVGAVSLLVLAVALIARYRYRLVGSCRWIYVASAVLSLYLNVFVLIVQAFLKLPPLQALAPTQSEPPFVIAQALAAIVFAAAGFLAARQFHPYSPHHATS